MNLEIMRQKHVYNYNFILMDYYYITLLGISIPAVCNRMIPMI
jgi:hypothetical protein